MDQSSTATAPVDPNSAEARARTLGPVWSWIARIGVLLSLALALNQLENFNFGGLFILLDNQYQLVLVGLLLPFAFVMWPMRKNGGPLFFALDNALAAISLLVAAYLAFRGRDVVDGGWEYAIPAEETTLLWCTYILWALLIEALRRVGGNVITLIVLVFSIYPVIADLAPGPFYSAAVPLPDVSAYHSLSTESIFGIPLRAFASLVIGFLLFGAALQYTGAGEFFLNIAFALFGGVRGGAAKVAIFASGLLGSMSGSVVTNVLTTGAMTIPAMKRTGFRPAFAGGVETCASTGGVLMPPVMGATAFVMATFLNLPYIDICIAATIPSVLYYFGLFMQIDAYAARHGMQGMAKSELPSIGTTFRQGWHYISVFVLLVFMLLYLKQEALAPFYATGLLIVVNQVMPYARWGWGDLLKFLDGLAKTFVEIAVLLLGVGMIVGAMSMTGVISSFANSLLFIAGDNALILLLMGAITSFVLGMGMTVTACYIFLAVLLAPALVKVGLDPLSVHLFIMYWGMLSFITPPVAIGAFAAASLANTDPMRTGFEAMRLGSIIYFIPFFFVLNPALIAQGSAFDIVEVTISAGAGIVLIAAAMQGWLVGVGRFDVIPAMRWPVTILLVLSGFLLAAPGGAIVGLPLSNTEFAIAGIAVAAPVIAYLWWTNKGQSLRAGT